MNEYYLARYMATAAVVGAGLQRVIAWAGPGIRGYVAKGLVLMLPMAPWVAHGSVNDMSDVPADRGF